MFENGVSYVDIQLYFDQVVYPDLEYIVDQVRLGNITKEVATKLAETLCKVDSISTVGQVASVMGLDAMKWFLNKIECVKEKEN